MSDQSQFVAGTIEDILLGMADGLADAQERLNLLDPFDAYGRPRPQYHVPYLDFDLKVYMQTRQDGLPDISNQKISRDAQKENSLLRPHRALRRRAPALEIMMAKPNSSSSTGANSTSEITSTISGRFVSIPPNDGMPQVNLAVQAIPEAKPGDYKIKVEAKYADGKVISGGRVELNVNEPETKSENAITSLGFSSTEFFGTGELLTDENGKVETIASFSKVPSNVSFVHIDIQIGVVTSSLFLER